MEDKRKVSGKKYLIFLLDSRTYAVPLCDVKEVIEYRESTPIPGAKEYLVGMINLRGKIISAIDLRKRITNMNESVCVKRPVGIIVDYSYGALCVLVDAVTEVLGIEDERIEMVSDELKIVEKDKYIKGVAKFEERSMILVLDLRILLTIEDSNKIKEVA